MATTSRFEYKITAPRSGKFSLTARVVTANSNQRLNISVNDTDSEIAIEMPFTVGTRQDSQPITLTIEKGETPYGSGATNRHSTGWPSRTSRSRQ